MTLVKVRASGATLRGAGTAVGCLARLGVRPRPFQTQLSTSQPDPGRGRAGCWLVSTEVFQSGLRPRIGSRGSSRRVRQRPARMVSWKDRDAVVETLYRDVDALSPRLKDRRLIRRFAATRDYDPTRTSLLLVEYDKWLAKSGLLDDNLGRDPGVRDEMTTGDHAPLDLRDAPAVHRAGASIEDAPDERRRLSAQRLTSCSCTPRPCGAPRGTKTAARRCTRTWSPTAEARARTWRTRSCGYWRRCAARWTRTTPRTQPARTQPATAKEVGSPSYSTRRPAASATSGRRRGPRVARTSDACCRRRSSAGFRQAQQVLRVPHRSSGESAANRKPFLASTPSEDRHGRRRREGRRETGRGIRRRRATAAPGWSLGAHLGAAVGGRRAGAADSNDARTRTREPTER